MFITTGYDGSKEKKKRSLIYRLFRLFHREHFGDDIERVMDMKKNDPSDIIVSVDEHNDS